MNDLSKTLIRCSRLSTIMTNIDSDKLTKGHLTFAKQLYREIKWRRTPQVKSKYLDKGIMQEEDALTLLARVKGLGMIRKNEETIKNDFLSGTPDVYIGESIKTATKGYDTKCAWDASTMPFPDDKLDDSYFFQNMGYMALTGATLWTTAFCLVNAPGSLIMAEKYALSRKMNCSDADPLFIAKCQEIEKNMIYDMAQFQKDNPHFDLHTEVWEYDIPKEERVIEFPVERDDNMIDRIYERVKLVRKELVRLAGRSITERDFQLLETVN